MSLSRIAAIHYSLNLIVFIALTILASSGAQVCQKLAAQTDSKHIVTSPYFLASLIMLAISLCSWLMVLARMDVGIAYPILSLNYLIVLLIAKFYFGETVPIHRWLGTMTILAGIVLLLSSDIP